MSFESSGDMPIPSRAPDGTATLVLRDPRTMRALAHPVRLRLLRHLRHHGPATATMLGASLGESPASASYHLRQLAALGFIEEVAERGNHRERWWRAPHRGTKVGPAALDSEETRIASAAMAATVVGQSSDITLAFIDAVEEGTAQRDWAAAATLDDSGVYLTVDELEALGRATAALLEPYAERFEHPSTRPEGAELVHVSFHAVPWLQR
jgi:DNA-binding transcriptional ArsR family regulator